MHMKFNGRGTTNLDWFSQNNLFQSPWTDLKNATNIFIFRIDGAAARSFEIAAYHKGCPGDAGWFLITGPHCDYEKSHPIPGILYSKKTHKITWNNSRGKNYFNNSCDISIIVMVCLLSKQRNNKRFPKQTSPGFLAICSLFKLKQH